jgi:hypothetical protein
MEKNDKVLQFMSPKGKEKNETFLAKILISDEGYCACQNYALLVLLFDSTHFLLPTL